MKQIISLLLVFALLTGCAAGAVSTDTAICLDDSAGVLVTSVLSEYENGEVLVLHTDGSCEVVTYEDEDTLAAGLKDLAVNPSVELVQPNYSYSDSSFATDDALTAQQWALNNDGSFLMEEEQNQYPVFEDPFETPSLPGLWTPPQNIGTPEGPGNIVRPHAYAAMATEPTTAVAGIDINAAEAWELYDGGSRDVVIALIDTGVDNSHEELADSIWVNDGEIPDNGVDDDGNGYIDDVYGWNFYSGSNQIYTGSEDSHGTHGAGTIAADADNGVGIAGIVQSEHVKIMVLKVLGGADGSGSSSSIIQAIQYAEANGATICNLSLGTEWDDRALYRSIASSSMLFVVAAGNDGVDTDASPSYPASYHLDNIISVANLSYDGTLHYSSNYGAVSVDIAAPGSYILSTTSDNSYSYMTGTSMAAPMVTAAAAMVYSYFDNITLANVKEILLRSTQSLDTLEGLSLTGGMLNLGGALSFDLNNLSGEAWYSSTENDTGSAPEITTQVTIWGGQSYLLVQITDPDDDLAVTSYAGGTLSASQFHSGSTGQTFSLRSDGTAIFRASSGGTYTLYAADSAGNETVCVITLYNGAHSWP